MKRKHAVQSYLSYSLATAHRLVHQSLSSRLKEFGVQVEAWRVMEVLESDPHLIMGDLAQIVLMNPSALTKLVDRMVSDGIVHRRVAQGDQRQINLILSELGKKRIKQIRAQALAEEDELTKKIGPERVETLKAILSEIGDQA